MNPNGYFKSWLSPHLLLEIKFIRKLVRGRLNEGARSWVLNLNPQAPWVAILGLKCKWQPLPCRAHQRPLPAPALCSVCAGNWVRGMSVLSAGFQTMSKQESSQYAGDHAGEMGQGEPHEVQPREAPSPALVRNSSMHSTGWALTGEQFCR